MFAGIGGFRSGLEAIGGFRCVGYCEIDPYPRRAYEALYNTTEEVFYPDAREIDPAAMPDLDLVCGGFPCQTFSIAGRRDGFADTRGTLFFEIFGFSGIYGKDAEARKTKDGTLAAYEISKKAM